MGMNIKQKKEIGTSFRFWDLNGDEFIILTVSSSRDMENRLSLIIEFDVGHVFG